VACNKRVRLIDTENKVRWTDLWGRVRFEIEPFFLVGVVTFRSASDWILNLSDTKKKGFVLKSNPFFCVTVKRKMSHGPIEPFFTCHLIAHKIFFLPPYITFLQSTNHVWSLAESNKIFFFSLIVSYHILFILNLF